MPDTDPRDAAEPQEELNTGAADAQAGDGGDDQNVQKLTLDVAIDRKGACERHIRVSVSRDDINRYFDREFSEMVAEAHVPGFRPGHAPRKLIEARYRKDVAPKVKATLLMDSIAQVSDDESLAAISEPDIDIDAVEMPAEGPLTFEFDIEVRPDFDLPQWKGLVLEKPVREITPDDVEKSLLVFRERRGRLAPHEGPAESGDFVVATATFRNGETVVTKLEEETFRLRPQLTFRDAKVEGFDKALAGVRAGESRTVDVLVSESAPNVDLRGKKIVAEFAVSEVKKLEPIEINQEFVERLGMADEGELRDTIKRTLESQLAYEQRRVAREQLTQQLLRGADWELPPRLLQGQAQRELHRAVLELQRSGFPEHEIRARENEIRQHSMAMTAKALKEHFILEKIAEQEKVDADEADLDAEMRHIARETAESYRRVRARLEKEGMMDVLRNQVVENKVVELILEHAEFKEVAQKAVASDVEAIDEAVGGEEEPAIPEAKPEPGSPEPTHPDAANRPS